MNRDQKQVKMFEGLVTRILENHYTLMQLNDAESRSGILTKIAPSFFTLLNDLLIRDFFLEAAKILESHIDKGTKRQNLTVRLFIESLQCSDEQRETLKEYEKKLNKFYPQIKEARNRIISHNDLATYEDEQSDGVGAFEEGLDTEFIQTLEEFYNYLHEIVFGEIWGDFVPNHPGDVRDLIADLFRAQAFEQVVNDPTTNRDAKMDLLLRSIALKKGKEEAIKLK